MRRVLTPLSVLVALIVLYEIFLPVSLVWAKGITFVEPKHYYSISLPAEWEAIPKEQLQEVEKGAAQFGTTITYDAGFRKIQSSGAEQFPYLLIQHLDAPSVPSPNEVMKEISDAQQNLGVQNEIEYNPTAKAILVSSEMTNGLKLLSAMMLGKDRFVQLHFYASKESFNNHLPDFNNIIESFKYDEGHQYSEAEAMRLATQASSINWAHILGSAITAGALGIWFQYYFRNNSRKDL